MIKLRTKTVSVHTNPGQEGGRQRTLVTNSKGRNLAEAEFQVKKTKAKVRMGQSGSVYVEVVKDGKLLFGQNIG